ncbi:MAG: biotin synthase BioB [Lachnospiraceae bacterium]|nr:biotin synthase BioB [Lachnospiraceae bacterium]
MNVLQLADEIIAGKRLTGEMDVSFLLTAPLEDLCSGADQIRAAFCGDRVNLCTILSGRSGKCSENCKFCAQSAHHHTACETYDLLSKEEILSAAKANEEEGVDRFSLVNSGYGPTPQEFEQILRIYQAMQQECSIGLCASLGFLTQEQFHRLYAVGARYYHNNIESSRRYFPQICTTHSFDDKIANIKRAQAEGFTVCSGGILGMGETWEDRIDMAFTLSKLHITSIPLNTLMPIPGTPLADLPRLSEEDILRSITIFRYINPEADIRLAGGRALMQDNGKRAFLSGASASITGNMLTTSGSTIRMDREMLTGIGRTVRPLRPGL